MRIEDLPIITTLETYVHGLPAANRAEAYRLAESFYTIGLGDGALEGALKNPPMLLGREEPKNTSEDKIALYYSYFARKKREAEEGSRKSSKTE